MVTESKGKNTDYSASAVKLVNPPQIKEWLEGQNNRMIDLANLQEKIDACIPVELKAELECLQKEVAAEVEAIKGWIDQEGSYQDLNLGWYAVKQREVSKTYNAEPFEVRYPEYSRAVIIKAVDVTKLTGLIKGGLINEEDLKKESPGGYPAVITEKEAFSYIIKV
jgi:hypothetical protein